MKRPYFQGLLGGIVDPEGRKVPILLRMSGGNTGNFLFTDSLHRNVVTPGGLERSGLIDPDKVRESHDGIIIPAANWLNERSDFAAMAAQIEKTDLPTVIVGLGAQSASRDSIPKIKPGTERLIKVISERCYSLSARGEFTAEVLEHYGVKNVTVTGCPSMLWQGHPLKIDKPSKTLERVAVHTNRSSYIDATLLKRKYDAVNLLLSRQAMQKGWYYVAQSELPDMYFAMGRDNEDDMLEKNLAHLTKMYRSEKDALVGYLREYMKVFFAVEPWVEFLKGMDFTLGTRIHGTVASLLAGTPALLIAHDTRTVELARAMKVPYVEIERFDGADKIDAQALYDSTSFEEFNSDYGDYLNRFRMFFSANGIQTRL